MSVCLLPCSRLSFMLSAVFQKVQRCVFVLISNGVYPDSFPSASVSISLTFPVFSPWFIFSIILHVSWGVLLRYRDEVVCLLFSYTVPPVSSLPLPVLPGCSICSRLFHIYPLVSLQTLVWCYVFCSFVHLRLYFVWVFPVSLCFVFRNFPNVDAFAFPSYQWRCPRSLISLCHSVWLFLPLHTAFAFFIFSIFSQCLKMSLSF